jgi:hypothetical protein
MRDLPGIRAQTFKAQTIIHAFANSRVWPINYTRVVSKLQKYSNPEPQLPQTVAPIPASFRDSEQVLVSAQLQELDYSILQKQVTEQRNQPSKSRRTLQVGGALISCGPRL